MKRLLMATVAMIVAVAWAGAATAAAQTQDDTDFGGGTHAGTAVAAPDDLALSPDFDVAEEFGGTALPAGWERATWAPGGSATVAGGTLTVDGARANTTALYDPGRSLDFAATFTADPFQHVGFGVAFENPPWAMFSTGGGALAGGPLRPNGGARWGGGEHADRRRRSARRARLQHRVDPDRGPVLRRRRPGGDASDRDHRPDATRSRVTSMWAAGACGSSTSTSTRIRAPGTFTSRVFDAGDSRATWRTLTAALERRPAPA